MTRDNNSSFSNNQGSSNANTTTTQSQDSNQITANRPDIPSTGIIRKDGV